MASNEKNGRHKKIKSVFPSMDGIDSSQRYIVSCAVKVYTAARPVGRRSHFRWWIVIAHVTRTTSINGTIFFFCRNDFLARLGLPQRRGKIHFHQSVLIALSAVMLYTVFSPWICPLDADHQTARHVKATVTHISLEQKLTFLLHRIDQGTAPHVGTSFPIKNHRVQGIIICFFLSLSLSLIGKNGRQYSGGS